jgi:hypothetical protein
MAQTTGELSDVQFQKMTEQEVWKLLTGRSGSLEVSWPASDDERIDLEAHIKESFSPHLSMQIKCASWLATAGKAHRLVKAFEEKVERLHSHALFWYLFGRFDLDRLEFTSPLFLADSERVHRFADRQQVGDTVKLTFQASMEPTSRDKWHDCKVEPVQLADRVLAILRNAESAPLLAATPPPVFPDGFVIGFTGERRHS